MYMLDTNIIIYAIKNKPKKVLDNIMSHKPEDICISSITYAELVYGVEKSDYVEKNWLALNLMLSNFCILDFDTKAAAEYGELCVTLERAGKPLEQMDLLIASHAKAEKCVLVTNNVRHFQRVPKLKIENWTK